MLNATIRLANLLSNLITPVIAPIVYLQARLGARHLPWTFKVWDRLRVTPVYHHYYQPIFNPRILPETTWTTPDPMYGIDLRVDAQLELLNCFTYLDELRQFPVEAPSDASGFFHRNGNFVSADAEVLYSMVRYVKPTRVLEIGSGYSTLIVKAALDRNKAEGYWAKHICIEPYEYPWLESLGVDDVIRGKVEDVDSSLFGTLADRDILFIDSSHVLRMGGDVYVEYLRILPQLHSGVFVHVHDIFLPYDYPRDWIMNNRWFWNEQYLLQAFLAFNSQFEVLAALHYLSHYHTEALRAVCPFYAEYGGSPGSFWMRRR